MFRATSLDGVDLIALFNAAPNPYVVLGLDLAIFGANEAYLKVVGRERDEIVGRNVFEAFPSDPQSPAGKLLRDSLAKVLADQVADEIALIPYNTARPGEPPVVRYWSATHTPIFDQTGAMKFILQHTTDVTELQQLREGGNATRDHSGLFGRVAAVQAKNTQLSDQTTRLRGLFEQAPSFIALLEGPNHVFELANAAYAKLIGHRRDVLGKPVAEALPEVVGQGFAELLDTVYRTGEPFVGNGVRVMLQQRPDAPLEEAFLDFVYQPVRDSDGNVAGIFVQGHDITEKKRAEAELARQSQVMRMAQEAGGIGTFEWSIGSGLIDGSPTFKAYYGLPPEPGFVPIQRIIDAIHPDDLPQIAADGDRLLEERIGRTEYRVVTPQGTRWLGRQGTVVYDASGKPDRVFGAVFDLTERKEAEVHMAILAQESAHRVKNMLALVQAIAVQTMRNSTDLTEARQAISARLVALGQAQDMLTSGSGAAAGIRDVVTAAARLHGETFSRFSIDGPNVMLEPKAVLGLGLMLHELGTNALKYGTLSVPDGRVAVRWTSTGNTIDWTWSESGGPSVTPPDRKGFGSKLIERGLSSNLGGTVELDYAQDGLVCHATIVTTA